MKYLVIDKKTLENLLGEDQFGSKKEAERAIVNVIIGEAALGPEGKEKALKFYQAAGAISKINLRKLKRIRSERVKSDE